MAKIYYNMIIAGKITFEQVPAKFKEEVAKLLEH